VKRPARTLQVSGHPAGRSHLWLSSGNARTPLGVLDFGAVKLDRKVLKALRALGRIGGMKGGPKGGKARMAALTPEERRDLARKAAAARWAKAKKKS